MWVMAYMRDSWNGSSKGVMHAATAALAAVAFHVRTASGEAARALEVPPSIERSVGTRTAMAAAAMSSSLSGGFM